jgi:hypothetical protein
MTVADLPPPDTKRWVASRKATLVLAVNQGVISLEDLFKRYEVSSEEFISWRRDYGRFGMNGLKTQSYQKNHPRAS